MRSTHLRLLNVALIAFWVSVGLLVLLSFGPHSPLTPGLQVRSKLTTFIPQGWNFFTRDPQEARHWFFEIDGDVSPADPVEHRGPGLLSFTSRAWRVRGMEQARLLIHVPEDAWKECKGRLRECAQAGTAQPAVAIVNDMKSKSTCGEHVVVHQRITPWAWFSSSGEVSLPARVAHIEVQC